MTSLREEITTIIDEMYKEYTTERISEEILSKIEKILDERIQQLDNYMVGSRPSDNEKEYTLKDVIARTSVNLGNIKKEILK